MTYKKTAKTVLAPTYHCYTNKALSNGKLWTGGTQ